jgi:hypothetical protein
MVFSKALDNLRRTWRLNIFTAEYVEFVEIFAEFVEIFVVFSAFSAVSAVKTLTLRKPWDFRSCQLTAEKLCCIF